MEVWDRAEIQVQATKRVKSLRKERAEERLAESVKDRGDPERGHPDHSHRLAEEKKSIVVFQWWPVRKCSLSA